jgi:creatinine amidohydrolase
MLPPSLHRFSLRVSALGLALCMFATVSLPAQVRKLHTRDLTRLAQPQVTEYLKRSDIVFVPIGSVETTGIMPSDRDYVSALGYAMAMADELDALYMPGLVWSYPGTSMPGSSTIGISPSEGIAFLKATSVSLIRAGFRRIIFLSSGHGPVPMTAGVTVREIFDDYRVPMLYLEMGEQVAKLNIPAPQRNRLTYGHHQIAGRLIDFALKGEYGADPYGDGHAGPVPVNEGYQGLGRLGVTGSMAVGMWVADVRAHALGAQELPATEAEREEWGKQGEAQVRAIVKQLKLREIVDNLKKHDEFTNKVVGPKFENILPPRKK